MVEFCDGWFPRGARRDLEAYTYHAIAKVKKPFVAYKVLAAGAIHPRDGFKYAFEKGADFVIAGMYDFQLKEGANIRKRLIAGKLDRTRAWA